MREKPGPEPGLSGGNRDAIAREIEVLDRMRFVRNVLDAYLGGMLAADSESLVSLGRILRTGARDTPVLVMSADDDHHTRDRAVASGATGFIPKPISEPQLRSEVTAVLQHRAALVDHRA